MAFQVARRAAMKIESTQLEQGRLREVRRRAPIFSVAKAELHGEILFVVFEAGHVAVFLNDSSMEASPRQV